MTNLSIGGDTFRVEVEGDATKPALLLAHALGADLSLWDAQMPSLLKAFRVIRYDSRGHGGTKAEGGAISLARLGRDALGILDAIEIETAHFIGVSMGGAVGQWLLVNAPHRIERAVLANTAAKIGAPAIWNERISRVLDKGMAAIVEDAIERWFSPAFVERSPETVAALRAVLANGSPEGYAACCAALRDLDLREAIRGVGVPVLVVSGRDDSSMGEDATRHLVEAIPGAKHVALDTRHISHVEADAAFSKAVVGFLTAAAISTSAKAKPSKTDAGRGAPARPATIVSRRVGLRRSTAARSPIGTLAKAPKTPSKRGAATGDAESKTAKGKIAEGKIAKDKIAKDKIAKKEAAPLETIAEQATSARAKAKTPAAPKAPAKTSAAATKAAPAKSAKRPSAKSLKAMATSASAKGRAVAKPLKTTRGKITAPPTKFKSAAPAAKPRAAPSKAVAAKTVAAKTVAIKTAAKTVTPKTARLAKSVTKASTAKTKTKIARKAKPGRRAS